MKRSAFTLIDPRRSLSPRRREPNNTFNQGFTLIELLVVIAIIAVLAVVVVLTLNPGQLILQSRDSTRLSDLASLQSAISLYQTDSAINGSVRLGSSSVVYVSLPDPSATTTAGTTCTTMGLPALPPAYTYHCAASSTFRSVNGLGWIPMNLSSITSGAPLGQLPIDPVNSSSTRSYLTYTTNGTQYELTSQIESSKYKLGGANDVASLDGGTSASLYEKGTNLTLQPLDYGDSNLVGYWTFDEGSGSIAYDYSGNNATGSWAGTPGYTTGKVGTYAGSFNGSTTYINVPSSTSLLPISEITIATWIKPSAYPASYGPIVMGGGNLNNPTGGYFLGYNNAGATLMSIINSSVFNSVSSTQTPLNAWVFVAATFRGNSATNLFINGVSVASSTTSIPSGVSYENYGITIGRLDYCCTASPYLFSGLIDDVRIYNRALSAAEVQALYNSQR